MQDIVVKGDRVVLVSDEITIRLYKGQIGEVVKVAGKVHHVIMASGIKLLVGRKSVQLAGE